MKRLARISISTTHVILATATIFIGANNLRAQSAACAAISITDVSPVVGSTPMMPNASGCDWTADKTHFVLIRENVSAVVGPDEISRIKLADDRFRIGRAAASRSQTVTDESGIGDRGYLSVSSSGVATLVVQKKDRILQVQLSNGAALSDASLKLLHVIAAKAITAF